MKNEGYFRDIKLMCDNAGRPEAVVRKWTNIETDDYLLPIGVLVGVMDFAAIWGRQRWAPFSEKKDFFLIARDIVQNSHLSEILMYDQENNVIRYRDDVSDEVIQEIGNYLAKRVPTVT